MALSNPFGPGSSKGRKTGSQVGGAVGATAGAIGGPLAPITVPAGTAIGSSLGGILGGAFTSSEEKNVSPTVALQPSDFEHSSGTEAHQGYARGGALPVTAPEGKLVGPSHRRSPSSAPIGDVVGAV